jgi:hypothetical protein
MQLNIEICKMHTCAYKTVANDRDRVSSCPAIASLNLLERMENETQTSIILFRREVVATRNTCLCMCPFFEMDYSAESARMRKMQQVEEETRRDQQ